MEKEMIDENEKKKKRECKEVCKENTKLIFTRYWFTFVKKNNFFLFYRVFFFNVDKLNMKIRIIN